MNHIIFGGDGFVGRHLAEKLIADGENVVIADIVKSDLPLYQRARFVRCDVTDFAQVQAVGIGPDDMVYNMAAKMLSPLQVRAKRWEFFWPVNYYGAENIMKATHEAGSTRLVQFTTDRGPSSRPARRIRQIEMGDRAAGLRLAQEGA